MNDFLHIIVPLLLILIDVSLNSQNNAPFKIQKRKIVLFVLVLTLYAGLRSPTTMTDDYSALYTWCKNASFDQVILGHNGAEPVYCFAIKLIASIFTNVQWYYLIHAFIVAGAFGIFVYRHNEELLICFLFFLTLRDFSFMNCAMRQGLSLAIIYAVSDKFLFEKRPFFFVLSVIAASLFHSSSIIFLIAYPLFNYIKWPRLFFSIAAISAFVFYFNSELMVLAFDRLGILSQYEGYITRGYEVTVSTTLIVEACILIITLIWQRMNQLEIENKEHRILSGYDNLVSIGCMFAFIGTKAGAMVRLSYLTSQYVPLMLCKIIKNTNEKNYRILFLIVVLFLTFQYGIFGPGQMGWDYHFFWRG